MKSRVWGHLATHNHAVNTTLGYRTTRAANLPAVPTTRPRQPQGSGTSAAQIPTRSLRKTWSTEPHPSLSPIVPWNQGRCAHGPTCGSENFDVLSSVSISAGVLTFRNAARECCLS